MLRNGTSVSPADGNTHMRLSPSESQTYWITSPHILSSIQYSVSSIQYPVAGCVASSQYPVLLVQKSKHVLPYFQPRGLLLTCYRAGTSLHARTHVYDQDDHELSWMHIIDVTSTFIMGYYQSQFQEFDVLHVHLELNNPGNLSNLFFLLIEVSLLPNI